MAMGNPTYPNQYGGNYQFSYNVKDQYEGLNFGHSENQNGQYTQGEYFVLLPDGRLQKVKYNVNGDSGFIADVSYQGSYH